MRTNDAAAYVGALFEEEQRLLLASVDPERPWAAFRRLRRALRLERRTGVLLALFHASEPIEQQARIIALSRESTG